ncbi:Lrp/AsnC family transcriptional regulator [Solicola sp. PLA-1-18]|uniref:Lrp/AsnC family transcriptional regulator n=1 Tax=Solicola sp. PLA-1-18 TaxID=3380532 RepID=UPI003B7F3B56
MSRALDALDVDLVELFSAEPHIGVLGASRQLGVARGTVQARLARLEADGVIVSWAPTVSPAALGFTVTAFLALEISQTAGHRPVAVQLSALPEVLEVHTTTGSGDLWVRCVARSNADLQRVIDTVGAIDGVLRTSTVIALDTQVPPRTGPLVRAVGPAD